MMASDFARNNALAHLRFMMFLCKRPCPSEPPCIRWRPFFKLFKTRDIKPHDCTKAGILANNRQPVFLSQACRPLCGNINFAAAICIMLYTADPASAALLAGRCQFAIGLSRNVIPNSSNALISIAMVTCTQGFDKNTPPASRPRVARRNTLPVVKTLLSSSRYSTQVEYDGQRNECEQDRVAPVEVVPHVEVLG